MKQELYIYFENKWNLIKLMTDTSVPYTFNIADIADITKKNGNYSKTITIPGDENNNKVFKHIYNISSYGSFIFDKAYQCYIIDDSEIIIEGYFELQKCIVSGYDKIVNYEAIIYSDLPELFTEMGDYLMRGNDNSSYDLDFSEYNHILNETNIRNSFYRTPGSGYTYILVDKVNKYSQTLPECNSFYNDELTPCLFIKEIFDKILEKWGYSYTSTFLESNMFKRLIYPHTNRWLYYSDDIINANTSWMGETMSSSISFTITPSSPTPTLNYQTYIGSTFSQGLNECFNETIGEFVAEVAGWYNVKAYNRLTDAYLSVNLGVPFNAPIHNYYRQFVIGYARTIKTDLSGNEIVIQDEFGNNMEHQFFSWQSPSETNPPGLPAARYTVFSNSKNHLINLTSIIDYDMSGIIYLNVGEKIKTQLIGYITPAGSGAPSYDWYITGDTTVNITFVMESKYYGNELNVQLDSKITDNCNVPVTQILHKEKQADFFNSIVKMFNLYIQSDTNKNLIIEPREDFYNLSTGVTDWTNKIDTDKDITIENGSDLRGAFINFKYKYDDDYFNENYKNSTGKEYGEYKQVSDGSNKSEYKIELLFAPTPGGDLSADSTAQVPKIFKLDSNNIVDESKEFKPRILYWKGLTSFKTGSNDVWFCYDRLGNHMMTFPVYHYPYAGHFDNVYGADTIDLNFASCDWYWYDMNGTWATWYNLTNKYYGNLLAELNDTESKLITMTAVLNKSDIQNFKFYNQIFIDGIHYKLNKISEWVVGEPCKIELLKSNTYNLFSSKPARPSWVRPIPVAISAPSQLIDIFDANISDTTSIDNLLDVDVLDANVGDILEDVIDANEGLSLNANTTNLYMDVIDNNIANSQSLSIDEITTSRRKIKKINIQK